ncbi:hypothetical protein YMSE1_05470 [Lactiplantibacillus plantarum]|uniref:helix-turn-helix transcriptional regulator n=2 Tax=Lactiplantibacillus plantarum TaxID=1590 RepID=UPI00321AA5A0
MEASMLGKRIHEIRVNNGMTMEEFISRIDGKPGKGRRGTVNNWEKGRNKPNKRRLMVIAHLAGTTVSKLLAEQPA